MDSGLAVRAPGNDDGRFVGKSRVDVDRDIEIGRRMGQRA